jgi:GDP-L-fucose synthase
MNKQRKRVKKGKFWEGKGVLVTGGTGFIGSHLVEMLIENGSKVRVIGKEKANDVQFIDLSDKRIDYHSIDLSGVSKKLVEMMRGQDVIFHLAARVAGIGYNSTHPATMLRDNLALAMSTLEAARQARVGRFQFVSSACVYPRFCKVPTPENQGFLGEPEPTNLGYGWAKRLGEILAKTYAKQYGLEVSIVRPYNGYGPRDNFDPNTSHVIPALIKRVVDGEDPVIVWGDGSATRSFLYVGDFARGLMEAVEKYPVPDSINIGSSEEISIGELVKLIIDISGSQARIEFDRSKPNGQPRRACDTRKARHKIGFKAKIPLREGLKKTIKWYKGVRIKKNR